VKINGVSKGTYLYDGEGKRVKKISDFETTIFVYDGGGQLVEEYSTQQATTPQVSYLTQDHLGSPRIITDNTGKVIARKDFNAFGDETNSAQRTELLGYKPEEIRQDYTGYQKDDESGLEFAQARYYNNKHGRFTSVDPMTGSANVKDPQTFNRYSYVLNSPYKFSDPLGLLPVDSAACGQFCGGDDSPSAGGALTSGGTENAFSEMMFERIYQKEVKTHTVVQSEADGRSATITITSVVYRTIDSRTGKTIETSNAIVNGTAKNTGTANFSQADLTTMENISTAIVEVATNNNYDVGST
jgi:RHS repeat-associated protein